MRHKFHLLQDEIKYKVQSADRGAHARNAISVPITSLSEIQIRDGPSALIAWQRQKGRHLMLRGEWRPNSSWLSMISQSYITQLLSYKDRNKKEKGWCLWISASLEKCVIILFEKEFKSCKKKMWFVSRRSGSKGVNAFQWICGYHPLSVLLNSIMRAEQFSSVQWVQDLHDMPQSVML